jgi:hypothetical protein
MSHGRRAWHTVWVLACVVVVVGSTGCRRSPFQRLGDDPVAGTGLNSDRPEIPRLLPVPDEEISSAKVIVPPVGVGTSTMDPAVRGTALSGQDAAPQGKPAPTPLLDAALERALAVEQVERQEIESGATSSERASRTGSGSQPMQQTLTTGSLAAVQPLQARPAPGPMPKEGKAGSAPVEQASAMSADEVVSWKESVNKLRRLAVRSATESITDDVAALWRVRAEVMDWMSADTSSSANEALLKKAILTIADAMKTKAQDTSRQSSDLRLAVLELEDRVPLGLTNLRVCRNVLGFGSFEPLETSGLKPGQPIILYCELTGLHYRSKGSSFVTRLSSRVELVNVQDNAKAWEQPLGDAEDECRSRRRDNYVNFRINLPSTLKPGDYQLRLTQTDLVASETASIAVPVTIAR